MAQRVFISHSSKDKAFIRRLVGDLQAQSVPLWYDELELRVGDSLREKIEEGLSDSGWLLVVLSENSVNSPWVKQELNAAFAKEIAKNEVFILPAVVDNCEIPVFLRDKVYADFRTSYETGFSALLERFGVAGERGKLIYSSDEEEHFDGNWTYYCGIGVSMASIMEVVGDDGRKAFWMRARGGEPVGVNRSVRTLHGSATFSYRVLSGHPESGILYFAMIPMQENSIGRSGLIEVGADIEDAPQNARSTHRERYFIPSEHYTSDSWHRSTLDFDFRDTSTAFYSIFAPRINEGCEDPGFGELLVGEISIRSYEWGASQIL